MKKYLLLFLLSFWFMSSLAQVTIISNPTLDLIFNCSGGTTNRSGIAYNPVQHLYYSINSGSANYPVETFDVSSGTNVNSTASTNSGFNYRGAWWNPNTNKLEGNGYKKTGIWIQNLDSNDHPKNTGIHAINNVTVPNPQLCGDYDWDADEIIYYYSGTIYRYTRASFSLVASTPITGLPVPFTSLNSYGIAYTGVAGQEVGVYDYINKRFYFINKVTGAYVTTVQLPSSAPSSLSTYKMGFDNGYLFLYESANKKWKGFRIIIYPCVNATSSVITTTSCDSYTLNSQSYTSSGDYSQTLTNVGGCDSIITLHLTINNTSTSGITTTACDSYSLNGQTYSAGGVYTQTLTNAAGCDSTITLNLTITNSTASTLTKTACDSYSLNGQTYSAGGTYTQALTNAAGCDSTITLNLTITNSTASTLTQTACDSYSLNGTTYNAGGTYTQTLTNVAGCDSTITLNLTITNSTASTLTKTACDSYSLNGTTYNAGGTYTQTLTNAAGCDSTITLNLTITNSTASTLTKTACDSYSLNGTTYNAGGSYTQTLTNASGCDSTITLNLTITNSTASTLTKTACDSYSLNGTTYNAGGTYTQTLTNATGCDSIITLNLTITNSTASTLTKTTCDSYSLNGITYNAGGSYTQTLTNATGCDSIITLNLTITNSTASTLTKTACDGYSLNGTTYNTGGIYTQTLTNASGCDSTITLNLTITNSTTSTLNESVCDDYTLNGTMYNANGTYYQTLTNVAGCDSVITLNLTINKIDTSVTVNGMIITANATGVSYQWIDCNGNMPVQGETNQTYVPNVGGIYAVIISSGQCSDTSACINVIDLGLTKQDVSGVISYPNPTAGNVTLDLGTTSDKVIVEIFAANGQLVSKLEYSHQNRVSFSIEGSEGLYMIKTSTADGKYYSRSILKE